MLPPSAQVSLAAGLAAVTAGKTQARFVARGIAPWRLEPGSYSPRFGSCEPTRRLVAAIRSESCRTEIRLQPDTVAPA